MPIKLESNPNPPGLSPVRGVGLHDTALRRRPNRPFPREPKGFGRIVALPILPKVKVRRYTSIKVPVGAERTVNDMPVCGLHGLR